MAYKPKYLQQKKLSDDDLDDCIPKVLNNNDIKLLLDDIEDQNSDDNSSLIEEYVPKLTDAPSLKVRQLPPLKLNKFSTLKSKFSNETDGATHSKILYNSYCYNSNVKFKYGNSKSMVSAPKVDLQKNKTSNNMFQQNKSNLIILKRLQMEK